MPSRTVPHGEGERPARRREWWAAAAVFVAAFLVYANTLGHGFVWDDLIWLDQKVRFYRGPLDAFFEPADLPGFPGTHRPFTFASFWLDQRLWWRNATGYHLTSIALHAANSALVVGLAHALGCTLAPAVLGGVLFAVHPVHTESVAWITSRVDVLATTFALLAVLAFLRYRTRPGAAVLAVVALCAFAAVASKEVGVTVPLLLLAAAGLGGPEPPAAGARRRRGTRAKDKAATAHSRNVTWLGVAAAGAGAGAYLLMRPAGRSPGLALPDARGIADLFNAFGFYVGRTLLPVFGLDAYVPEPPSGVGVGILAAGGLLGAAWLILAKPADGGRRRFAALWFVITLAPSLLVVLADLSVTAVAERYLYLPTVGLSLLVAAVLPDWPIREPRARAATALLVTVLVVFAALTVMRNRVWKDEVALWENVTRSETRYALPYLNLGLALSEAGRDDEAEHAYRTALAAKGSPENLRATTINLGQLELGRGRLDEAARLFERANAIGPHASAYYGLGRVARTRARAQLEAGDATEAAREFARARAALDAALAINPRHHLAHFALASVLYQTGDVAGAVAHYRQVVALAGDTPTGRDAAEALRQLGAAD